MLVVASYVASTHPSYLQKHNINEQPIRCSKRFLGKCDNLLEVWGFVSSLKRRASLEIEWEMNEMLHLKHLKWRSIWGADKQSKLIIEPG